MKTFFRFILSLTLLINAANLLGQNPKLGHINTQELLSLMPESDSAQAKIQKHAQELEKQLEIMQVEYNNKLEQYFNEKDKYSEIILQTKEAELQELQNRIQKFQQTAQQSIQKTNQTLFQPVLDKANKAIEEVAREKGFTYIFDSSAGVLIYTAENSKDILSLVTAKLGLE